MQSQMRNACVSILLSLMAPIACAAPFIQSITVHPAATNPNLVPNFGFTRLDEKGVPIGWTWDRRNTDAVFSVLDTRAKVGGCTLRIINHTSFGPNVYGTIWTTEPIHLTPGATYTLSCWSNLSTPTTAWIGGGDDWNIRLYLPDTHGYWKRFSTTFTATQTEADFTLRINTDGPTDGWLLRDLKLEPGSAATFCLPETTPDQPQLNMAEVSQLAIQPATAHSNLVPNSGFTKLDTKGVPIGWTWDRRNTDASFSILDTKTQDCILRITNHTPFGPGVFGTMTTTEPIHLTPGTTYTLSCWSNLSQPTAAWIGGGDSRNFRLYLPNTHGHWKRFSTTFTAASTQAIFTFRINTDGPTDGWLLRDIKLEPGSAAIYKHPETTLGRPQIELAEVSQLNTDRPWTAQATLYNPRPISHSTLLISIQTNEKKEIYRRKVKLTNQLSSITINGNPVHLSDPNARIEIKVFEAGYPAVIGNAYLPMYSMEDAQKHLQSIENEVPNLVTLLNQVKARGLDIAYPQVSVTILRNLPRYAAEMLAQGQIARATPMIEQLSEIEQTVYHQLVEMLERRLKFPPVPSYVAGPIIIRGPEFIAETRMPGHHKVVRRPVIFTGWGAFDQVRKDIEKLPSYGCNIVQIELGPSVVFPKEGVVTDAPVKDLIALLQRAAKAGVAVNLLISPHYMPDWVMKKYPDLNIQREGFLQYDLFAPEGRAILKRFLDFLIPQIKGYPALQSICLSNEPVNAQSPVSKFAQADWHQWLKQRYHSLADINQEWGSNYPSFDAIPLPNSLSPPPPSPIWYAFVRFNQDFFAGWHGFLADTIHRIAPKMPVHAKTMTWTLLGTGEVRYGLDATLFGKISQINGNDSSDTYNNGQGEWADDWQLNNMAYDLQHSVLDAPIFNSENHLMPDRGTNPVPPAHLRTALWQGAIHGQGATTIWCWQKTFDPKADFWGLEMERPTDVQTIGDTGLDLMRLAPEVGAFQNLEPQVQILFGTSPRVYDDGDFSNCLNKTYTALNFTGLKIGFITERQLEAGIQPSAPIVFVPDIQHLSDKAYRALQHYRGQVILIGGNNVLEWNDYGKQRSAANYTLIPFDPSVTTERQLLREIQPILRRYHDQPLVSITGAGGQQAVWGVERLCARYEGHTLVNLVNYLNKPVQVRLEENGRPFMGRDILSASDERIPSTLTLQPLHPMLVISDH